MHTPENEKNDPPPPPRPSADAGIHVQNIAGAEDCGTVPDDIDLDVFALSPVAALKMLCSSVEELVKITGDVPPTPISHPTTPLVPTAWDKENKSRQLSGSSSSKSYGGQVNADGVPITKTPIGSPEAGPMEPFHIIGSDTEPLYVQHGHLTRKFYSKKPPPISLEEYLLRLHQYCPMSTAVYLATALYIHRLAIVDHLIPVTGRNAHRLVLAGLRVAMKALEDISYAHQRFAAVGGVTELELGRLEISFCFLTNFELRVSKEMLHDQAVMMREGLRFQGLPASFQPILPFRRKGQNRPAIVAEINPEMSASAAG